VRLAPRTPEPAVLADERSTAPQVRAFAWYLGAVIVGASLLWAVVPSLTPTESTVTAAFAVAVARGATLDGPGIAYVAVLFVASVALAVLVYGTSQNTERLAAARLATAVAAELALRDVLTGAHSRYAL